MNLENLEIETQQSNLESDLVTLSTLEGCSKLLLDACESLTYKSYHPLLEQALSGNERVATVLATEGAEQSPVGLALAVMTDDLRVYSLLSIAVSKSHRRLGIAGLLLNKLEKDLICRGAQKIEGVCTSKMLSFPIISRVLEQQAWSAPEPRNFFCRGSVQNVHDNAAWMQRIKCPDRFEVFPWMDLKNDEREQILFDIESGLVPADLSPFQEEDTIEPYTSVGIRSEDRVVGWQTNHPLESEAGVLRYSYTFAYPEFQKTGRALILIKEAIVRNMNQKISEYPEFVSSVAYHRKPMLRFYKRHLTALSRESYSSYGVSKTLGR